MSFRAILILFTVAVLAAASWLILSGKKATVSTQGITKEARDVLDATQDYTDQQKEAFAGAVEGELEDMEDQIQGLRARSRAASGRARADLDKAVEDLERRKKAAAKKLAQLKSSKAQTWAKVKVGMTSAMKDLKVSYQRALGKTRERP